MPWFRFIGEDGARFRLRFRNGDCEFTFANLAHESDPNNDGCWAWVARNRNGAQIVLVRRGNVMALQQALTLTGFEVAAGSAAERIMRAAEKARHAEELPGEERWRREIIQCRGRRSLRPEGRWR